MASIFDTGGLLGGDSIGLDFNTGNPLLDILATAATVATTYKVVDKLTGGNDAAAKIVAGATGLALTSVWNPMETVMESFKIPDAAAKAPDAALSTSTGTDTQKALTMPTAPPANNDPAALAAYNNQLMLYNNQQSDIRYQNMLAANAQATADANKKSMYGSIIGAVGQGLLADRTAEKQAAKEKALMEEKYQLDQQADQNKYDPAAFNSFGEYLAKTGRAQQVGNTGITQVGNVQTANDQVAAQQVRYQDQMAKMAQQQGRTV